MVFEFGSGTERRIFAAIMTSIAALYIFPWTSAMVKPLIDHQIYSMNIAYLVGFLLGIVAIWLYNGDA